MRLVLWSILFALALSCSSTPPAYTAIREERVRLGISGAEVLQHTGAPDLWVAAKGVETMYFRNDEAAVSISLLHDKVVAYADQTGWPESTARAAEEADHPVTNGLVRAGMTEAQVRQVIGDPDGITAQAGVETLHWVTGDEVDSVVELKAGKVVGYVAKEISEFTQNIPSHDRSESTTSGKIRVGMPKRDVKRLLSEPTSVSAKDGQVIHRYESGAVMGDDIHYFVRFKADRVVGFSQYNATKAEEKEEMRLAAERQREAANVVFQFLMEAAVQQAITQSQQQEATSAPSGGGGESSGAAQPGPAPQPVQTDECSCPEMVCNQFTRVQQCRARCTNARAVCTCSGVCGEDSTDTRQHSCGCS